MTQSPGRTSAISCPAPNPRHSAQGTVSNQDSAYRSRLKAISATPDSKSLLDCGTLVPERDEPGSDHHDRRTAPDSDLSPLDGLSLTSAIIVGVQSNSSRPLRGNHFFVGDGPVRLHSQSAAVAASLEETRGNRNASSATSMGLQHGDAGPHIGSVPLESRC